MHKALDVLRKFRDLHGDNFTDVYRDLFRNKPDDWYPLDLSRREVNRYYTNVAEMHMNNLISRRLARMLTAHHGLNSYYEIVFPMNMVKYGPVDHYVKVFKTLKKIRKSFGDGRVRSDQYFKASN